MKTNANILYLSHGGGPLPLLGDLQHQEMVTCLQNIAAEIPKPDAILVISAHWEEKAPAVTAAKNPNLLYDYYGFPEQSYRIQYPCAGNPRLAEAIAGILQAENISCRLEGERGLDHGVFVPLKIMYPQANIPCIQLSLLNSLDAEKHLQMGWLLRAITTDRLLVIGSGFSFHNMQAFFGPSNAAGQHNNQAFEGWLKKICCSEELTESERWQKLVSWHSAPGARYCHPREEHLLPLHVCYGMAQAPVTRSYSLSILNKQASMYLWQNY